MIVVKNLIFSYPSAAIFEGFAWQVMRGEAWSVIGPSGCGKTTLLMLAAGLRQPAAGGGQVLVDGQVMDRPRPRTGLILQDYGLLPWATVWDNVALGLKIRGFYGQDGKHTPVDEDLAQVKERVIYWLQRLKIDHVSQQYPNQISGGQRQRTAVARTLVLQPDLLLMDEPFGALDALTREDLQSLVMELRAEQGLTTVIVTHNIEEAAAMGQKILVLRQPPIAQALVVENAAVSQPDYRSSEHFFACCNRLRTYLEEGNHALA